MTTDETLCLTDLMATCAAITGATLPEDAGEDSYDMLPSLRGSTGQAPIREATIHHSIEGMFAIRAGQWKMIEGPGSGGWTGGGEDDPAPGQRFEMRLTDRFNRLDHLPDVRPDPAGVFSQLEDRLQGGLLGQDRTLDVGAGPGVHVAEVTLGRPVQPLLSHDELMTEPAGGVAGGLAGDPDGHVIVGAGDRVGARSTKG